MHQQVIRNAYIVDGTGNAGFHGDVAIDDGKITAVGSDVGAATNEIDADGRLLTPGWVDIHSHYDGQATWDPHLIPSGGHGVTTTIFGNCGVGFAPARPTDHEALITIMEGVEDIPGSALSEGLSWAWESFPEYLAALDNMPRSVDIATMIPHSAVRAYVMGPEESIRGEATASQRAEMRALVCDAVKAGAIGFSTSRTKLHLGSDGKAVPGSFIEIDELVELSQGVNDAGGGMLQLVTDFTPGNPDIEFELIRQLASQTGLPVAFNLVQFHDAPENIYRILELVDEARASGLRIQPGVGNRPVGMLINFESEIHPFSGHPTYQSLAHLPAEDRLQQLRHPHVRDQILSEETTITNNFWRPRMTDFSNMFILGNPPNYEPLPEESIAHRAAAAKCTPQEMLYDLLVHAEETDWIMVPLFNYASGDLAPQLDMMTHPDTVMSLADGGAHCRLICDASAPTYTLTHWVNGRDRGARFTLEQAVAMQTAETAAAWGLHDRGTITPGARADLNLIDLDRLRLLPPRWASDLPANGRRLLQDAEGYDATFVLGTQTWADGEPTGAMPGQLIRGTGGAK